MTKHLIKTSYFLTFKMYIKIFCEHKLRIHIFLICIMNIFLASHDGTISVKFIKDV